MKARRGPPPKLHHDLSTSKTSAADEDLFFDAVQLLGTKEANKESGAARKLGAARSQTGPGPKGAKRQGATPQSALSAAEAQLFEDAMASLDGAAPAREVVVAPTAEAPTLVAKPFQLNIHVAADLDDDAFAAALEGQDNTPVPVVAPAAPAPRKAQPSKITDKQFRVLLDKGRMRVGSDLDLHGHTVLTAHDAIAIFLTESLRDGVKVVRIVHGKGMHSRAEPVLRDLVRRLLRQQIGEDVIAMTTPPERFGGDGATVCLLRTEQPES